MDTDIGYDNVDTWQNWSTDSYDIWFMKIATQNGLTNLSYHYYGNAVITFINSHSFPFPPADLVCLSTTPWAFGLSLVTMNQIPNVA